MKQLRGFTLIELMIVIAIMGILTTVAMPTFQERVIRVQVGEAIGLADFAKEGIAAYYRANKRMPKNNAEAGLPPADKIIGNYVTALEVIDGAIHVTLGNRINRNAAGKLFSIRPAVVTAYPQVPIAWNCGVATPPAGMKVFGESRTSLAAPYLPVDCRS
jgi:type IV pilus assembly protein PilA